MPISQKYAELYLNCIATAEDKTEMYCTGHKQTHAEKQLQFMCFQLTEAN